MSEDNAVCKGIKNEMGGVHGKNGRQAPKRMFGKPYRE